MVTEGPVAVFCQKQTQVLAKMDKMSLFTGTRILFGLQKVTGPNHRSLLLQRIRSKYFIKDWIDVVFREIWVDVEVGVAGEHC